VRRFLIDTDTASDDAVALVMALRSPGVRVEAVTVVSGNVPLAQATENALYTLELCGAADVPVFMGADRPLVREPAHAQWFHGDDGFGNQNYPPAKLRPRPGHAAEVIARTVRANPGIELVTLGPLTNVAMALTSKPSIVDHVKRCVVMGGNPCCEGNVTPAAEYNIWCDPEAARIVFRSGMNLELVGWQLCRGDANLNAADIAHVRSLDTKLAHFAIDINRVAMQANLTQCGEHGIPLPDPVAMAVALDPSIATESSRHRVEIECASELTRGMTVVDRLNVSRDERNRDAWNEAPEVVTTNVVWKIDVPRWKQLLYRALAT
jgi:inosine-uridine nucleoside N-ribohydrolase